MNDEFPQPVATQASGASFEVVLPHLSGAYRLARWLMRNDEDAEDVVREASLRAFRYFRTFTGGTGRAWFFRIVRNTCAGWRRHGSRVVADTFDEEQHSSGRPESDPETLLLQADHAMVIARAMRNLSDRFHRPLVLREFEGLPYRELANALEIPVGTVMSRLSRARQALRDALGSEARVSSGNIRTRREVRCVCARPCSFAGQITRRTT
jgi:RNA polymerase sigma-70 factor (ECF subfamily)